MIICGTMAFWICLRKLFCDNQLYIATISHEYVPRDIQEELFGNTLWHIRSSWVKDGAVRRRFCMNMFPRAHKRSCLGTFVGIFVAQERGETLRETFRGDLLRGGLGGEGGGAGRRRGAGRST